jgi:2-amino-4-hydroxy-6-hydroxymethyldihydropteridine diphosphokinase
MTTPAWISLGSNLGDRKGLLDSALQSLGDEPGVVVRAVSSYHETQPVGGPPGQGPFLNAVAHLETTLDPYQLLAVLQAIERRAGRDRAVRWGERTLDLDILIFDREFIETDELKVPHPRLALRRFVLEPLAEIAPEVVELSTNRTIADLLANLDRRPRLVAINGLPGPRKRAIFQRLVEELPGFGIEEEALVSSQDRVLDPLQRLFESWDRKIEALKGKIWAVEKLRVSWIVADYDIVLDLRRGFITWSEEIPQGHWKLRQYDFMDGMQRAFIASQDALVPTLVVILPGDHKLQRGPGLLKVPQLWPDSNDPDAIVAEVLATCRAIEEG